MNFQITIDPLKAFDGDAKYITTVCGILPLWATNGGGETMKDSLKNQYAFYTGEMTGGSVDDDGVYSYPEDSDLYPMLKIERLDGDELKEVCTIYEYAIVACRNVETGDLWVTRMD